MQVICSQISTHSQEVKIAAIFFCFLVAIAGIFQIYRPFLAASPAAGWGFVSVAVLGSIALALHHFLCKKRDLSYKPQTAFPKEILLHILDFLDPISLAKSGEVSKQFYHLSKEKKLWKKFCDSENPKRDFINKELFIKDVENKEPFSIQRFNGSVNYYLNYINRSLLGFDNSIYSFCYANGIVFGGGEPNTITLWILEGKKWIRKDVNSEHKDIVKIVIYANDRLFSGSRDGTIKIWEVKNNKLVCEETLKAHQYHVSSLAFENDALFSGSWDSYIKMWQKKEEGWISTGSWKITSPIYSFCIFNDTIFIRGDSDILIYRLSNDGCHFDSSLQIRDPEHHGLYPYPGSFTLVKEFELLVIGTYGGYTAICKKMGEEWIQCELMEPFIRDSHYRECYYSDGILFCASEAWIRLFKIQNDRLTLVGDISNLDFLNKNSFFAHGSLFINSNYSVFVCKSRKVIA